MININLDPVAFLGVRWYGIMVALGILLLILWTVWQVRKGAKLTYDTVFAAALVGIPSGVIISRLLHVIDNIVGAKLHPELVLSGSVIDYTLHPTQIIGGAGLTIWGAVLGTALGIWIYSKFTKVKFGYLADVITPGIILAQAIGRIGCTINGCCYGTETTLPWAVAYTHPDSLVSPSLLGVPLHPTTIYEIIYLLIIFGVVLGLRNRLKPDGSLFMVYLSLYSLWRVGIDFLREGTPFLFGLHQAQVIAIITLAICIPLLITRMRRAEAEATIPLETLPPETPAT